MKEEDKVPIIVGLSVLICYIIACSLAIFIPVKENVIRVDTVVVHVPDSNIVKQIDSLCHKMDSIEALNVRYEEELNIALFKLDRIKEYNRIAGNGNNIKYLRGWINRVLE